MKFYEIRGTTMINLKDKLSHLTYRQACKLLGPQGEKLIRQGGRYEIDLSEQVVLQRNLFQLNLDEAVVMIRPFPTPAMRHDMSCLRHYWSLYNPSTIRLD